MAVDDRFVLLIGGYTDGGGRNGFGADVLVYDRTLDRYTPTAPLPMAVGVVSTAVAGGKVYVVGGEDAPKSRSAKVYVGDIE